MTAVGGQRVIEERLKDVVEEVVILAVFAVGKAAQEIVRTGAPVLSLGDAEPAFLLEKVEKHDLAQELLGEVDSVDVLLELVAQWFCPWRRVFPEPCGCRSKSSTYLFEELFGDGLDAERFLNVQECWIGFACPEAGQGTGSVQYGSFRLRRRCRRNVGPA